MEAKVVFFPVDTQKKKLIKFVQTCHLHFEKKRPLLIRVIEKHLSYVDDLLWSLPKMSFLPHIISDSPCKDLLVITCSKKNLNSSPYLFNLTPEPLIERPSYTIIYEFDDQTHSEKKKLSENRLLAYKQGGWAIASSP